MRLTTSDVSMSTIPASTSVVTVPTFSSLPCMRTTPCRDPEKGMAMLIFAIDR